jgi:SAM-dependent methyltransferase
MTKNRNNRSKEKMQNNKAVFADYARYYDLLYRDKDYAAEAEYVACLIRKFHPAAQSILELGSGTGKHACLLVNQGYRVHGIELSQEMMVQSQSLAIKKNFTDDRLSFTAGDIREIRLEKRFDAVIALFHVISYQTTNEDVAAAFKTARHHLKSGGIFIFDVWYGPAVLTQQPEVRIKRTSDEKIEVTRLAEPVLHPNENRVDVNYHIFVRNRMTDAVKELKETHAMRYFFKPEIEYMAKQTGFNLRHAEEWLSGKEIGCDTWGACFVLQTQ